MELEVKRKVKKEVEETYKVKFQTYWVVRVIRIGGYNNKECIYEKEFLHEPSEQEIADVISEHMTKQVFASVNKNYRFVEVLKQE